MSFGCATPGPIDSPATTTTLSPDLERARIVQTDNDKDNALGWALLYVALNFGGTAVSGK